MAILSNSQYQPVYEELEKLLEDKRGKLYQLLEGTKDLGERDVYELLGKLRLVNELQHTFRTKFSYKVV